MCRNKKKLKDGKFFFKIHIGHANFSSEYECIHAQTPLALFLKISDIFAKQFKDTEMDVFFHKETNYRGHLASFFLASFIPESAKLILDNSEILRGNFGKIIQGKAVVVTDQVEVKEE